MGEVAEQCQNAVPDGGTEERVKRERSELHFGKARRNRNQLTDNCDEAADERRNGAVFAEVVLCFFNLLDIEQQKVSEAAVGEFVNNWATENLGEVVVDIRANQCAECRKKDDQCNVEAGTRLERLVGGWRHDEF